MLRRVAAVILGALVAGIVVGIVEAIGHLLFPLPAGVTPETMTVEDVQIGGALFVILAWGVGTIAGGVVAARVTPARPVVHAYFVGGIMMACGLANLIAIPSPWWFWVAGLAVFPPAAWLGGRIGARQSEELAEPPRDDYDSLAS